MWQATLQYDDGTMVFGPVQPSSLDARLDGLVLMAHAVGKSDRICARYLMDGLDHAPTEVRIPLGGLTEMGWWDIGTLMIVPVKE